MEFHEFRPSLATTHEKIVRAGEVGGFFEKSVEIARFPGPCAKPHIWQGAGKPDPGPVSRP